MDGGSEGVGCQGAGVVGEEKNEKGTKER